MMVAECTLKRWLRIGAAALAAGLVLPDSTMAQSGENAITAAANEDIFVHNFTELREMEGGETIHWSGVSNRLIIGRPGASGYFNVYSISPEGFRPEVLTLSRNIFSPYQHRGCPAWHPGGRYFVFSVQNPGSSTYRASSPMNGLNCNLWLGERDGGGPWQLTQITTSTPPREGVLLPQFSPDGKRLFWSGNTGVWPENTVFGQRALYLAEFRFGKNDKPELGEIEVIQPGEEPDYYTSHGFSPDGHFLLFAGNVRKNQSVFGIDLCTYDLRNRTLQNLTDSPEVWDQFGAYSPDGRKIVWMSSAGQEIRFFRDGIGKWQNYLKSELWIMDADGGNPKQLTAFNRSGSREYVGRRCFVGDSTWSPDGKRIAICLHQETGNRTIRRRLLFLELGLGEPEGAKKAPLTEKEKFWQLGRTRPQNPAGAQTPFVP